MSSLFAFFIYFFTLKLSVREKKFWLSYKINAFNLDDIYAHIGIEEQRYVQRVKEKSYVLSSFLF